MRAGGMSDSSKWKKQKRSPRPPRHMTKVSPSSELPTPNGTTLSSNLTGEYPRLLPLVRMDREKGSFLSQGFLKWKTDGLWSFC